MKKILYFVFIFTLFYGFTSLVRAGFDPDSQTVVDYGNVTDEQIAAVEAVNPAPAIPATYNWFTPALQKELDSFSSNQPFTDWSSLNY